MRFELQVDVEGDDGVEESYRLSVDGRDVRKWEAATGGSFLGKPMTMTLASQLAYFAAVRTGKFSGTIHEWDAVNTWAGDVRSEEQVAADSRPTRKGRGGRPPSA